MTTHTEDSRATRTLSRKLLPLATLAGFWTLASLVADPRGDFPLNDDWSYGLTALELANHGTLRFTNWVSMPLVVHAAWGALFCKAFGASFTALRLANIAAGLLAIWGSYGLLLRTTRSPVLAFAGAATLGANPIFLGLSHTFMTDITFLLLTIMSALFFIHALNRPTMGVLFAATLFAVAATLVRQLGIAPPLAFAATYFIAFPKTRSNIARAILPLACSLGVLISYGKILAWTIGQPARYSDKSASMGDFFSDLLHLNLGALVSPARGILLTIAYVGLFLAPLAPLALVTLASTAMIRRRLIVGSALILALSLLLTFLYPAPWTGNVWLADGIGPVTLEGGAGEPAFFFSFIMTFATIAGVAVLPFYTVALVSRLRRVAAHNPFGLPHASYLFILCVLLCAPPALQYGLFFDRYIMATLPFALVLSLVPLADALPRLRAYSVFMVCVPQLLLLLFSAAATHDYLLWNRVRWDVAEIALQEHSLEPAQLNGGFEFNLYSNYANSDAWSIVDAETETDLAQFILSFTELHDYESVSTHEIPVWLAPRLRTLRVLRRTHIDNEGATARKP